jgi:hypothetical protein
MSATPLDDLIEALVDARHELRGSRDLIKQLESQIESLKTALANTQNELAMERVANPSTTKTVAINALESLLQHNERLIADEVLKAVRPEAQAYIERCLAERRTA